MEEQPRQRQGGQSEHRGYVGAMVFVHKETWV